MNPQMIVQAWKNPEYRASLALEQRQALPENPSGTPLTELDENALGDVIGGAPEVTAVLIRPTDPRFCCFYTLRCPTLSFVCRDLEF